jgi:phytanoyl-CoA hydroxylase
MRPCFRNEVTSMNASADDIGNAAFWRDGYLLQRAFVEDVVSRLRQISTQHLDQQLAPVEYEVDVKYPGAPTDQEAEGAATVRRLLQSYSRHVAYRDWACHKRVVERLSGLFGSSEICLSQCHHNCVMTKSPGYSSVTQWHQDNRYWSFDEENLISVWFALGDETIQNGCLRVIPGSHQLTLEQGRFDAAQFLRTDLNDNKSLTGSAVPISLSAGDVLFFHSKLLHAAGRNLSNDVKLSLVFTYHLASNHPISDTRSARFPSIPVGIC